LLGGTPAQLASPSLLALVVPGVDGVWLVLPVPAEGRPASSAARVGLLQLCPCPTPSRAHAKRVRVRTSVSLRLSQNVCGPHASLVPLRSAAG